MPIQQVSMAAVQPIPGGTIGRHPQELAVLRQGIELEIAELRRKLDDGTLFNRLQPKKHRRRIIEQIVRLKARMNDITPIGLLPDEVLVEIFAFYAGVNVEHDLSSFRFGRPELPNPYLLLQYTVARVCSRWREVALGTPHLWTDIHLSNDAQPNEIAQSLRRSGSLPLRIIGHRISLLKDLAADFSRARRLALCINTVDWIDDVPEGLQLRSLELLNVRPPWDQPPSAPLHRLDLSHLRALTITGVNFDCKNMPILPCLVHFSWKAALEATSVMDPVLDHYTIYAIPDLMSLLCKVPSLRTLELRGPLEPTAQHLAHKQQTDRPQLQRLYLDAPLSFCAALVDHVSWTQDTIVHIRTSGSLHLLQHFQALGSTLAQTYWSNCALDIEIRVMPLTVCYRARQFILQEVMVPQPVLDIDLSYHTNVQSGLVQPEHAAMMMIGRILPAEQVESLTVSSTEDLEGWKEWLAHMRNVSALRTDQRRLCFALAADACSSNDHGDINTQAAILLPRLKYLVIDHTDGHMSPTAYLESLIRVLESRQACGRRLEQLELPLALKPFHDFGVVSRLAGTVQTLTWREMPGI
ncbi:hypothetical protein OE88DRAFT_1645685 [Heliocybe sulcata]|uniref:F-box domain-containing protein n=1 Tax=Heliocybe sulcata TaxID=5364 RepID=A0A5C3N0L6_9AGAM|nr:hypothetical protein OE88DRAFT_1645685 [Heliocybe sulcata]